MVRPTALRAARQLTRGAMALLLIPFAFVHSSRAGTNSDGTLLLHANLTLVGSASNCGYSQLRDCKAAVTQAPANGNSIIFFVIAVFPDYASPRVSVVTFGIQYDNPDVGPITWGTCGDLSLGTTAPPFPTSGSGLAVEWDRPQQNDIFEICWFESQPSSSGQIKLCAHPTQGGHFIDDSTPAESDDIESYGKLGFGSVSGLNPCSDAPPGACCDPDGACVLELRAACESLSGYTYVEDYSVCSPNPCTPGMGACCIRDVCRLILYNACLDAAGTFMGSGVSCVPLPCNPMVESSWGQIKQKYRIQ